MRRYPNGNATPKGHPPPWPEMVVLDYKFQGRVKVQAGGMKFTGGRVFGVFTVLKESEH
ncbi:MAG TPA: hypothetical protein VNW47_14995 [Terriglobales bacterium]|nr:hypothetical protein [Terriglobales bacterium]